MERTGINNAEWQCEMLVDKLQEAYSNTYKAGYPDNFLCQHIHWRFTSGFLTFFDGTAQFVVYIEPVVTVRMARRLK